MKVEVHDLKHEKWFLNAEPSDSIGDLKKKNLVERKLDEASNQKMIYSGKILKDTDTLGSINYSEGKGFIVCMVSKKKTTASTEAPATSRPKAVKEENKQPSQPAATEGKSPDDEGNLTGPSALLTGSNLSSVVANIMDMGYSQQQVVRALRQAYNNPDRAVEYLVTGQVPETLEEPENPSENTQPHSDSTTSDSAGTNVRNEVATHSSNDGNQPVSTIDRDLFEDGEMEEDEDELIDGEEIDFHELLGLDDDQLNELRSAVRQNPQEMLRLLDPLVRSNPQIAETLINNLDQFMHFLQSAGDLGEDGEMTTEPGAHPIAITPEEEQAINRLTELGFEFDVAALAYLACEKDEQLTANYLLEHGHEM